ncbi:MAG: hypothetical protein HBSAPP03_10000 [Phycisphaerae bacterium]|nr:MAG: hypothetical protein HBSAPP03_10000 [Phycisphaerae bacterium]
MSPTQTGDWTAPHYDGLPAALGGGAIGLVPYALHRTACSPTPDSDVEDHRTFLNSAFCHLEPNEAPGYDDVSMTWVFYGPVLAAHPTYAPITARHDEHPATPRERWMTFEVTRDAGNPLSREVVISGNGFAQMLPGLYHAAPASAAGDELTPLLCDGVLPAGENTPVAAFASPFDFALLGDCNRNGIDDVTDIEDSGGQYDLYPPDGKIDYCYAGLCDGDVNCDGSANGQDVEATELAVGGDFSDYCQVGIYGYDDGDFNRDGAVNGLDAEAVENAVGGVCP